MKTTVLAQTAWLKLHRLKNQRVYAVERYGDAKSYIVIPVINAKTADEIFQLGQYARLIQFQLFSRAAKSRFPIERDGKTLIVNNRRVRQTQLLWQYLFDQLKPNQILYVRCLLKT